MFFCFLFGHDDVLSVCECVCGGDESGFRFEFWVWIVPDVKIEIPAEGR